MKIAIGSKVGKCGMDNLNVSFNKEHMHAMSVMWSSKSAQTWQDEQGEPIGQTHTVNKSLKFPRIMRIESIRCNIWYFTILKLLDYDRLKRVCVCPRTLS